MMRFVALLLIALSACAAARAEPTAAAAPSRDAKVAPASILTTGLSSDQLAKLQQFSGTHKVVWAAGRRQSDGTTSVCHVTLGKSIFGTRVIGLLSGVLERDGSYHQTMAQLQSKRMVLYECHKLGFNPPVRIR